MGARRRQAAALTVTALRRSDEVLDAPREVLAAERARLELAAVEPGGAEHEERRSRFFDRVVARWDTHPAGAPAHRPPR